LPELQEGYQEHPFREIHRLQTMGDDIHVLSIVEALQDRHYLYIVTPWCDGGGSVGENSSAIASTMIVAFFGAARDHTTATETTISGRQSQSVLSTNDGSSGIHPWQTWSRP
jgi:hypothetical protein